MMNQASIERMVRKINRFCNKHNVSICANYKINLWSSSPMNLFSPKKKNSFIVNCDFNNPVTFTFSNN